MTTLSLPNRLQLAGVKNSLTADPSSKNQILMKPVFPKVGTKGFLVLILLSGVIASVMIGLGYETALHMGFDQYEWTRSLNILGLIQSVTSLPILVALYKRSKFAGIYFGAATLSVLSLIALFGNYAVFPS